MAAPVPSFIILPSDSANAGKQIRTETRVINALTVHEQFVVPTPALTITGTYWFSSTQQSASTLAQDGLTTAFFWIQNPIASTITAFIRHINCDCNAAAATTAASAPVISFAKFTFTGTASGASVSVLPYQSAGVANQMIVRTAVTGMTPTLGASLGDFSLPAIMTAVGPIYAMKEVIPLNPIAYTRGQFIEIGPGEGLVIYQSTAGTASDPRRFICVVSWFEVDLS